jgi:hypothetical protein
MCIERQFISNYCQQYFCGNRFFSELKSTCLLTIPILSIVPNLFLNSLGFDIWSHNRWPMPEDHRFFYDCANDSDSRLCIHAVMCAVIVQSLQMQQVCNLKWPQAAGPGLYTGCHVICSCMLMNIHSCEWQQPAYEYTKPANDSSLCVVIIANEVWISPV